MQEINVNAFCIINALGWYRLMATSFSVIRFLNTRVLKR